ncbi:hypothetical protein BTVI_24231 [Pitangus sulphuratus]|nr:hypothetical protein BTVI_24231 [Pitangus sulphuratus]
MAKYHDQGDSTVRLSKKQSPFKKPVMRDCGLTKRIQYRIQCPFFYFEIRFRSPNYLNNGKLKGKNLYLLLNVLYRLKIYSRHLTGVNGNDFTRITGQRQQRSSSVIYPDFIGVFDNLSGVIVIARPGDIILLDK